MKTKIDYWELETLKDKIRTVIITLILTDTDWERQNEKMTMSDISNYSVEIAKLFWENGYRDHDLNKKTIHKKSAFCTEIRLQMAQTFTSGNVEYDIVTCEFGDEKLLLLPNKLDGES